MKRMVLFLPFLAAALIAAGCGSDDDSTAASNADATVASADEAMKEDEAMKAEAAMKEDEAMKGDEAMKAEAAMAASGAKIKVVQSEFGAVIADRKGEALYLFDREGSKKAKCYGNCAKAWPPVLTGGKPVAGVGAEQSLLGTTKRANGKLQVTYAGHPLYYYVDDSPGTILCNDVEEFGGLWLVVQPSGRAVS